MTKAEEILEKHLANNIDQRTYLRGSKLTYNICIDAINEAINYTHCCTELKDKEAPTFEDYIKENRFTHKINYTYLDEDCNEWLEEEIKILMKPDCNL